MGVGMVIACAPENVAEVQAAAAASDTPSWILGDIRPGSGTVQLTSHDT
jgi:phosphoribosylaminoimidazole (AIR) synthetase